MTSFLHPWALLLGFLALTIPFVVHWLTRPKPATMPLSTIRFVQAAFEQRRKTGWLRDVIVLTLRSLAIVGIAFAFARPLLTSESGPVTNDPSATVRRVVVLDASQSMAASNAGVDGFQNARVQAARYLKSQSGLRANLIVAGASPKAVFEGPSTNMKVLQDALIKAHTLPEELDAQAAINMASAMVNVSDEEQESVKSELVIISDFQRTNWASIDFSSVSEAVKIDLKSTASEEVVGNLAIIDAGFPEQPAVGDEAVFQVTIGNYTQQPKIVSVQVTIGDSVHTLKQACPAKVKTTLSKKIKVNQAGWLTSWARLMDSDDGLVADDQYPFVVQSSSKPSVLIVSRQPSRQRPSSSYFLHRALSPYEDAEGNRISVSRIATTKFSSDVGSQNQAFLFDHPGLLNPEQIQLTASMMRRGRGVLYIASEAVDATNLKRLYDALNTDLQAAAKFSPLPKGVIVKEQPLGRLNRDCRVFSGFADSIDGLVSELAFVPGLASERVAGALDDEILAALSDQTVLLMKTKVGAGNFSVLNCDLEGATFPRHPAFVPIVNELIAGLLQPNLRTQMTLCGEPLTRLLPASVTSTTGLKVLGGSDVTDVVETTTNAVTDQTAPSGMTSASTFQQSGAGVVWKWKKLVGPTTFQVLKDQETVFALASHLSSRESDLRTLDANVMVDRLAVGRNVTFSGVNQSTEKRDDGWIWFAVAALLAMMGEVCALRTFKM